MKMGCKVTTVMCILGFCVAFALLFVVDCNTVVGIHEEKINILKLNQTIIPNRKLLATAGTNDYNDNGSNGADGSGGWGGFDGSNGSGGADGSNNGSNGSGGAEGSDGSNNGSNGTGGANGSDGSNNGSDGSGGSDGSNNGSDGLGGSIKRIGAACSKRSIDVFQGQTPPLPSGIPTYTVDVHNICVSGKCNIGNIHLSCGWFSTARTINPTVFRRVSYDDCLVNNGQPIGPGQTITFQYANTYPYPLTVSSVACF